MSTFKRATDTAYTFRFLKLLTQEWTKTEAFEMNLIDKDGNLLKKPKTNDEKNAYSYFHRLIFNIKRLMSKLPFASKKIVSYASALYLLKAHTECDEDAILEYIDLSLNTLDENNYLDFNLKCGQRYQLNKSIINPAFDDNDVPKGSSITIIESVGENFGVEIFKAKHSNSNSYIYVSKYDIGVNLYEAEVSVTSADIPDIPKPLNIPKPLKHSSGNTYQLFQVPTDVFRKFNHGRKKYQRWSHFLDLTNDVQSSIHQFSRKYHKAIVVLQDESSGAIQAIRCTSCDGN